MRDMLFSTPLGPMPGERVEVKPALGPIPPQFKWMPVEGNYQVEINGLGQMRTAPTALPPATSEDLSMVVRDAVTARFLSPLRVSIDPGEGDDWTTIVSLFAAYEGKAAVVVSLQEIRPADAGSLPNCFCDSCNLWRKLGR